MRWLALLASLVVCGVLVASAVAAIQASFTCSPSCNVTAGTTVTFNSTSRSSSRIRDYAWDLDGDGLYGMQDDPDEPEGTNTSSAQRAFPQAGSYTVGLRVRNVTSEVSYATQTVTVTAPPPPPGQFRLDVSVTGGGSVKSEPAGIDCGSDCSEAFPEGTPVKLDGVAGPGFRFGGWRGACTGENPTCALSLDAAKSVEAGFVPTAGPTNPIRRPGLIVGTETSDVLRVRGRRRTVVYGLGGNDKLIGGKLGDTLIGGPGNDSAKGGKGPDTIIGGAGNDNLSGGPAADTVAGGIGRDRLKGGPGKDTLFPGGTAEAVNGGSGKDRLVGGRRAPRSSAGGGPARARASLSTLQAIEKVLPVGPPIAYIRSVDWGAWGGATPAQLFALGIDASGKKTGVEQIYNGTDSDGNPSWSPTGLRLAYDAKSNDGYGDDIYTISSNGTGRQNLTPANRDPNRNPAWSPDGQRIAFVRADALHVMNANGTGAKLLVNAESRFPEWSPDGQKIYFAHRAASTTQDFELFTINPDGSGVTQLTANDVDDQNPALSPNGKLLAWDSGGNILVRPLGFPFPLTLASDPNDDYFDPTWSPDGKRILFHRNYRDLLVANLSGDSAVEIEFGGTVVPFRWAPSWRR